MKNILSTLLFCFLSCCIFTQDTNKEKYQLVIIDTNTFQLYNYYRFYNDSTIVNVICEKAKKSDSCLKKLVIDNYYQLTLNQTYLFMFVENESKDTSWIDLYKNRIGYKNNISFGGYNRPVYRCDNLFGNKISCNIIEERKRFNFRKFKRQRIIFK